MVLMRVLSEVGRLENTMKTQCVKRGLKMNNVLLLSLLALGYQTASAQLVTKSFGSGDNAFSMEFVTIGNPGNSADTTGSP